MGERRRTDADNENHADERDYCPLHELHKEQLTELKASVDKRVTWVVFSIFVTVGLTLLVFLGNGFNGRLSAVERLVIENSKLIATVPTKGDIRDLKNDLRDMLYEHEEHQMFSKKPKSHE